MSAPRPSRSDAGGSSPAPVRLLHLGLGNFFRAHQCWYTDHATDAAGWGFAAFTGRRDHPVVDALNEQDGLFTLISRAADGDRFELLASLARAHPAGDNDAWLRAFAATELAAVTITITEAGYLLGAGGGLDAARPDVQADVEALRRDSRAPVRTAPARIVAGLAARRRAGTGPVALVPCDNLPGNGALVRRVVGGLAERVDPALATWIGDHVAFATTMVDRITPRPTDEDVRAVLAATRLDDRCPVVAEPFGEWVLSGRFPAGRPRWEDAGATFTDDVTPFERRKLWLLNGAHSLLAYAGSARGYVTVPDAVADDTCRAWLEAWWSEASPHLDRPDRELAAYRAALLERFSNPRMRDRLDRIAVDGSQKLPVRILPVLRAERAAGRVPGTAARVLAAWVCHLRGVGAPVEDARAEELVPLAQGPLRAAVPEVLRRLDPALAADGEVVGAVIEHGEELERGSPPRQAGRGP